MKKELNSKFEIRLDFQRDTEDPRRLFLSFAEIIEGANSLDYLMDENVNTKIQSKIVLDDIEQGSIIGRFYDALVISKNGQLNNASDEEGMEESSSENLNFIDDKKSIKDFDGLKNRVSQEEIDKDLKDTFSYGEPASNIIKLAEFINSLNNPKSKNSGNESFKLRSRNTEVNEIITGTPKIDINAVEKALTENEIVNESEMFYMIKRPDFLGDSAWEFKYGSKILSVKILHQDWLDQFHSGQILVMPGDSLQVLVRQTSRYNRNRYLIAEKFEIIEVVDVIQNNLL